MHKLSHVDTDEQRTFENVGAVINYLDSGTILPDRIVQLELSLVRVASADTPTIDFWGRADQVRNDLVAITQRRARTWL